jgi:hypothetical protein
LVVCLFSFLGLPFLAVLAVCWAEDVAAGVLVTIRPVAETCALSRVVLPPLLQAGDPLLFHAFLCPLPVAMHAKGKEELGCFVRVSFARRRLTVSMERSSGSVGMGSVAF